MPVFNRFLCVFTVLLLSAFAVAQAPEEQEASITEEEVAEVLVVGEQPGPGLWRVYKGDHVLWILGILSPLPKNMQWHSRQVEEAVANSQELLMPPNVTLKVGFWAKVGILPSLIGVKNNPDGKKLVDVLPEDLYLRWSLLKEKYIGKDNDIEKTRPIFAATELSKKSIEKSGMVAADSVRWKVEAIVKSHNIKTTVPKFEQEFKNPRASVKKFKKLSLDDTECFKRTLDRLETDLGAMRIRANAWATGDLETLRNLPYHNEREDCETAVLNSEIAQEQGLQDIKQLLKLEWVTAAETALASNESTFAMLSIAELYKKDGYLAALEEKGYSVERPE